jgi:microcystin-dependent protein
MGQPFIGEIRMFGGNFAPAGWAFCDGQEVPISENDALFQLIGTTYGGDGQSTFALPNLQSRVPTHVGQGFVLGQQGGEEQVTLTVNQIAAHGHSLNADENSGTQLSPTNNILAQSQNPMMYRAIAPTFPMNPNSVLPAGGNQPHDNMLPILVVSFIISLFGIFPSQS